LLEYICPGGKAMNRSQSSLRAFISEANQTDPAKSNILAFSSMALMYIQKESTGFFIEEK